MPPDTIPRRRYLDTIPGAARGPGCEPDPPQALPAPPVRTAPVAPSVSGDGAEYGPSFLTAVNSTVGRREAAVQRLLYDCMTSRAMCWIAGGKAAQGGAASPGQMCQFETQWLAIDKGLTRTLSICPANGSTLCRTADRRAIALDMRFERKPNPRRAGVERLEGHSACNCYRPPFLFSQSAACGAVSLRPGKAMELHRHADGERLVVEPHWLAPRRGACLST